LKRNRVFMLTVFPFIISLVGCVTVKGNGGLPSNQPPFRITKLEKKFKRTDSGGILSLHITGEILQAGWEIEDRLDSYSFGLKYHIGEKLAELRQVMQWFLQFKPLFGSRKGAPRGNPFDTTFDVPLSEKDIKNCVFQVVMGGDVTEDFLLYYKGRYYPEGRPYEGELPEEHSKFKQPDWAKPPAGRDEQDGLGVDKDKGGWRNGGSKKSP